MNRRDLIETIEVHAIEVPLARPFATSRARQLAGRFVIVEVRSGGLCGYGEADPRPHITGETIESVVAALRKLLIPAVIGKSIYDFSAIHAAMAIVAQNPTAKSAIDLACYDLAAKALNLPLFQLLGGSTGKPVIPNAWCGLGDDPDAAVGLLQAKLESGLNRAVKVKVGSDAQLEDAVVSRISELLPPGCELIADANQAWDYPAAVSRVGSLTHLGVTIVEQPLLCTDLEGMRRLTRSSSASVMADESMWSPTDAFRLAREEMAAMFNVKLMKCGGLYPAKKVAAVAESAGVVCMVGSTVQTSIAAAAQAHLAASSEIVGLADIALPEDFLVEDVAHGFVVEHGEVVFSAKPGLGIEVDMSMLKKYSLS